MIHSPRRERKTKAIAEALAMIADAHPPLAPHQPHPVRATATFRSVMGPAQAMEPAPGELWVSPQCLFPEEVQSFPVNFSARLRQGSVDNAGG